MGTYMFVDQHKKATPITQFVDIGAFLQDLDSMSRNLASSASSSSRR